MTYNKVREGFGALGTVMEQHETKTAAGPSLAPAGSAMLPRRLLVIFNPAAGWRRRRRLDAVLAALGALGCAVDLRRTLGPGCAERIAAGADPAAVDAVVAAGGDGTVNEVINGLAESGLPLGIIPLGTANVLAAEIGLGRTPASIAATLAHGPVRPVHVGRANGRRFAMMTGVGFDAHVVAHVSLRLKRSLALLGLGKLAYAAETLSQLLVYRRARYEVLVDGVARAAASVVVAKGHFYGGRFQLAREARLADPCFHVVLFGRSGRLHVLRYAAALLLDRIDRLPDVEILRARTVEVRAPAGEPVQGDGDLFAHLPLSIRLADRSLGIVAP